MAPPGAGEELQCYAYYVGYRMKTFRDRLLRTQALTTEPDNTPELFDNGVDAEDEGWVDLTDASREAPQEQQQDIVRLAQEGGPLRQGVSDIQQQALKSVLEAAGLTGELVRAEVNLFVSNTGWLTNCDTIDDLANRLLDRYPTLKWAKPAMQELIASFVEGRKMAAKRREYCLRHPPVKEVSNSVWTAGPVKRLANHGDFADLEEVSLDDDNLTEPVERIELPDWDGDERG